MFKTLIIIPAYNEAQSIEAVIKNVKSFTPEADIIVINDGSEDKTADIAIRNNVTVLNLPCNSGIGVAVQTGLQYAEENGYDIACQVDGDNQHNPEEIKYLMEEIINKGADIIIGSRFLTHNGGFRSSFIRRLGIRFLSIIISVLIGQKITDPTSGFRAFNKKGILYFSKEYPSDYPEPESIIIGYKNGLTLKEIAVKMNPRMGGESSIKAFRSVYYILKVTLAIMVCMIKKYH